MDREKNYSPTHHYFSRIVKDLDEKLKFLNTSEKEVYDNMRHIFELRDGDELIDMPQYLICRFERDGKTYLAFNKKYSAIDPNIYIEEKEFLGKIEV